MGTEIRIPFGKLDTRFAMIAMRLETKDTHLLYTRVYCINYDQFVVNAT